MTFIVVSMSITITKQKRFFPVLLTQPEWTMGVKTLSAMEVKELCLGLMFCTAGQYVCVIPTKTVLDSDFRFEICCLELTLS